MLQREEALAKKRQAEIEDVEEDDKERPEKSGPSGAQQQIKDIPVSQDYSRLCR